MAVPKVRCPRCSTVVDHADGFSPICPSCGFAGPDVPSAPSQPPIATSPAPTSSNGRPLPSQAIAIVALVLNLVVWPGLGTMVASRIGLGLAQGFLMLFGLLLLFTIILFPLGLIAMGAAWVWALVTGIQLIQATTPPAPPRPA